MNKRSADPGRARVTGIILLLLVTATIAVFWRACQLDFLNDWDDGENVSLNRDLNPVTPASLARYWAGPQVNLYIPATFTVWGAVASVARTGTPDEAGVSLNPWLFHAANLAMHLAVVLLVFQLLRRMVVSEWAAGMGALLFAIHPIQVEPVAWVTGMKDLLSGALSMSSLLIYLRTAGGRREDGSGVVGLWSSGVRGKAPTQPPHYTTTPLHHSRAWPGYVGAAACLALAMLAKPSAASVPLVAAAIDRLILRRPWRRVLPLMLAGLGLALPVLWVTRIAQPAGSLQFIAPLWERPFVAADAIAFYFGKLLLPIRLLPDYGRSPWWLMHSLQMRWTWAVTAGLAVAAWLVRRRMPRIAAAFAISVLALTPVLGIVPFVFQDVSTVADRYAYIAMLGPALALAAVLEKWGSKIMIAGAAAILAAFAIRSYLQVPWWQDEQTLFQHELAYDPYSLAGNTVLGTIAGREGMRKVVIDHALAAAHSIPDSPQKFLGVGRLHAARGEREEAIDAYRQALRLDPGNAEANTALVELQSPATRGSH